MLQGNGGRSNLASFHFKMDVKNISMLIIRESTMFKKL